MRRSRTHAPGEGSRHRGTEHETRCTSTYCPLLRPGFARVRRHPHDGPVPHGCRQRRRFRRRLRAGWVHRRSSIGVNGLGQPDPGHAAAGVAIGTGWRHRRAIPAPHRAGNTTELAPVPAMDEPDVMPAVVSRPGPPGGRIAGVPPPWRCAPDCDDGLELRLWNVAEELEKAAMVEPGHYAEAARELASTRP